MTFGKSSRTRFAMLNWNLWHTWEHYGNVVVYLRLKGLVPPRANHANRRRRPPCKLQVGPWESMATTQEASCGQVGLPFATTRYRIRQLRRRMLVSPGPSRSNCTATGWRPCGRRSRCCERRSWTCWRRRLKRCRQSSFHVAPTSFRRPLPAGTVRRDPVVSELPSDVDDVNLPKLRWD